MRVYECVCVCVCVCVFLCAVCCVCVLCAVCVCVLCVCDMCVCVCVCVCVCGECIAFQTMYIFLLFQPAKGGINWTAGQHMWFGIKHVNPVGQG